MRTAYCVLRIGALSGASFGAYCVLRTAYCVFEALSGANVEAYCVLRIAYCVFEVLYGACFGVYCVLRIAYCVLTSATSATAATSVTAFWGDYGFTILSKGTLLMNMVGDFSMSNFHGRSQ